MEGESHLYRELLVVVLLCDFILESARSGARQVLKLWSLKKDCHSPVGVVTSTSGSWGLLVEDLVLKGGPAGGRMSKIQRGNISSLVGWKCDSTCNDQENR